MNYSKEELIDEAVKRLDALDDDLKTCQEYITSAIAERQVIRYLLFLSNKKG